LPSATCTTTEDPSRTLGTTTPGDGTNQPSHPPFHDLEGPFFSHKGRAFKAMELSALGHVVPSLKSHAPAGQAARLVIEWTTNL
jgi:hypothetical protein